MIQQKPNTTRLYIDDTFQGTFYLKKDYLDAHHRDGPSACIRVFQKGREIRNACDLMERKPQETWLFEPLS
ncbi:hypothetical protein [Pajaroellobacter abortibovis]|uniref:Uncharacterized protein n=1 Tax=Pajaroellobacter abortibovis TaxID=1882918 RepID=A0A1L6MWJ8_9BACT|nr:hypothetical protein [Pajaroellobacter abortibovis]APR99834.1 hypothetical protein BCY86_03440 [Pajaroellobacter abortibovis]